MHLPETDTQFPITRASSTGRCNTLQCIDSTMIAREKHLFGCTRSKPSQSSVAARLTLTSEFGFCFQCQAGSSLVLRRPIETTRVTGNEEPVTGRVSTLNHSSSLQCTSL